MEVSYISESTANVSDNMTKFRSKIGWSLAVVLLLFLLGHSNAAGDAPAGVFSLNGKSNWTSKISPIRLTADPLPPLVHILQAFDETLFPNVVLTVDCRTVQGETLPEAFVGPNQFYQIIPDISSDPTVCWSCAVKWEEGNKWNDYWVFSHGACEMPFACDVSVERDRPRVLSLQPSVE